MLHELQVGLDEEKQSRTTRQFLPYYVWPGPGTPGHPVYLQSSSRAELLMYCYSSTIENWCPENRDMLLELHDAVESDGEPSDRVEEWKQQYSNVLYNIKQQPNPDSLSVNDMYEGHMWICRYTWNVIGSWAPFH